MVVQTPPMLVRRRTRKGSPDKKCEVSTSQVNISGRNKTLIKHFQRGSKGGQRQRQCQGRFRQHPHPTEEVMKTELAQEKNTVKKGGWR